MTAEQHLISLLRLPTEKCHKLWLLNNTLNKCYLAIWAKYMEINLSVIF